MTTKITKREEIVNNIIDDIEAKQVLPWQSPYLLKQINPYNPLSKHEYQGMNFMCLSLFGDSESNAYCTYKQAQEAGLQVKKGAKGLPVFFFTMLTKEDQDTGKEDKIPCNKTFTVFRIEDIEGYEKLDLKQSKTDLKSDTQDPELDLKLQGYLSDLKAFVNEDQHKAYYSPVQDLINLPKIENMAENSYYSTLLHEMVHSTGHETRLKRKLDGLKGKHDYSFEELIAELGSIFLKRELGIANEANIINSKSYIAGWLKVLKNDKTMLFRAASKAEQACNYIMTKIA